MNDAVDCFVAGAAFGAFIATLIALFIVAVLNPKGKF